METYKKRLDFYYEESHLRDGLIRLVLSKIELDGRQLTLAQIPLSCNHCGLPSLRELEKEYNINYITSRVTTNLILLRQSA